MRLLMYQLDGVPRLGVAQDDNVIDLQRLAEARGEDVPADILGVSDREMRGWRSCAVSSRRMIVRPSARCRRCRSCRRWIRRGGM
jgi:hypothetical protein